jgi:Anhydro-N-acetylmuramic acid kinase
MDALMRRATGGRKTYDADGKLARQGALLEALLENALAHEFFARTPPRATGHEDFGLEFVQWFEENSPPQSSLADRVRTALELSARSMADSYARFLLADGHDVRAVVLSGGGAHNSFLCERLSSLLAPIAVRASSEYGVPAVRCVYSAFCLSLVYLCVCVCVCVCYVRASVCVCVYVCACVSVCLPEEGAFSTSTNKSSTLLNATLATISCYTSDQCPLSHYPMPVGRTTKRRLALHCWACVL